MQYDGFLSHLLYNLLHANTLQSEQPNLTSEAPSLRFCAVLAPGVHCSVSRASPKKSELPCAADKDKQSEAAGQGTMKSALDSYKQ